MTRDPHAVALWLQPVPSRQQLRAQCAALAHYVPLEQVAAYVEADSLAKEYAETFNAPPRQQEGR